MIIPRIGEIWNNLQENALYLIMTDPFLGEVHVPEGEELAWLVKIKHVREGWELHWRTINFDPSIWERIA